MAKMTEEEIKNAQAVIAEKVRELDNLLYSYKGIDYRIDIQARTGDRRDSVFMMQECSDWEQSWC